jgi:hypothetical protein
MRKSRRHQGEGQCRNHGKTKKDLGRDTHFRKTMRDPQAAGKARNRRPFPARAALARRPDPGFPGAGLIQVSAPHRRSGQQGGQGNRTDHPAVADDRTTGDPPGTPATSCLASPATASLSMTDRALLSAVLPTNRQGAARRREGSGRGNPCAQGDPGRGAAGMAGPRVRDRAPRAAAALPRPVPHAGRLPFPATSGTGHPQTVTRGSPLAVNRHPVGPLAARRNPFRQRVPSCPFSIWSSP